MYIKIEWVDSTFHDGWQSKLDSDCTLSECTSVGIFIKEDKGSITIAQSESPNSYGDRITIPKCSIRKRRELK
jgi:hypothetical protein